MLKKLINKKQLNKLLFSKIFNFDKKIYTPIIYNLVLISKFNLFLYLKKKLLIFFDKFLF